MRLGICRTRTNLRLFMRTALLCWISVVVFAQDNEERQDSEAEQARLLDDTILIVRTGSPRLTLQSWLSFTREAESLFQRYMEDRTHALFNRRSANARLILEHLDLSQTPAALRTETGLKASYALADILARVELPAMDSVPDWDPFDESTPGKWRIPGTPITIARIDNGPRTGEFLFSARTVAAAPRFYQRIRHLPVLRPTPVESWTDVAVQMTGPLIPQGLVGALPDSLKLRSLDVQIWKIIISVLLLGLAAVLIVFMHSQIRRRPSDSHIAILFWRVLTPLMGIALTWGWWFIVRAEVNVTGTFAELTDLTLTAVNYVIFAWLLWLMVLIAFEWLILSPRISEESLNAGLLRLGARSIGFVGVVLILAVGAGELGIPVLGVVAGLGFGGLAAALAIRPTLENLVGGIVLFMDRPVCVGDFCTFGNHTGTVENIGIRSTQIRALDRTLISVPNAVFVDMELINWAKCDRMLILTVIGLRYETEPDQLRQVLARLREMLYAHPKIDRSTVRVRYVGYGPSSREVQIRVYALTQEWNEFYAIREDVFLRVDEIVAESGTAFAFPSQTLYLGRDGGLDQTLGEAAKQQVDDWRRSGILPFPDPAASRIDDLAGTLDYPPRGSVEEYRPDLGEAQESEGLSESPPPDASEDGRTTKND